MDEVMMTLPVLWRWLLGICGMVVAIGGAAAVLAKLRKPWQDVKTRLNTVEKEIQDLKRKHKDDQDENIEKFNADLRTLADLTDSNRHMCGCMLALLDHMISGNSIDKMKDVRDEMRDWLIKGK